MRVLVTQEQSGNSCDCLGVAGPSIVNRQAMAFVRWFFDWDWAAAEP